MDENQVKAETKTPVVEEKTAAAAAPTTPVASSKTGKTHRYVCPACTGVAYYSSGVQTTHPVGNCQNCAAPLGAVEPGNFVELSDDQKQALVDQGII
jgi:hypothetical protein